MVNLDSYIGTLTADTIWTGLVFELPLVVLFLARVGIVGPEFLRTYRRHAYVLILVVGAIITPPDVTSQLLVSIPLIALYEGSILLAARALRAKDRAEARSAKAGK
jgi:sec-independent protein translocase protein TatC